MDALKIIDDADLLKRLSQNDERAFRYIFEIYFVPIRNNILQFICDRDVAADIHQEVFITLWERRNQLPSNLNIKSWLFTVSYNKSISFLRKKSKISFAELSNDDISDDDFTQLDKQLDKLDSKMALVTLGIKQLSPQRKKAFLLYKISKYSYKDIATEMNLSTQTVKQYVKMAMMFLRKYAHNSGLEICATIVFLNSMSAHGLFQ